MVSGCVFMTGLLSTMAAGWMCPEGAFYGDLVGRISYNPRAEEEVTSCNGRVDQSRPPGLQMDETLQ